MRGVTGQQLIARAGAVLGAAETERLLAGPLAEVHTLYSRANLRFDDPKAQAYNDLILARALRMGSRTDQNAKEEHCG